MGKKANILLFNKLNSFIKKYYLNKFIKGIIYSASILFLLFIIFSIVEHFLNLDVSERTFIFWTYILVAFYLMLTLVLSPILKIFKIGKIISHKHAAKILGDHFVEIDDKLINLLQLNEMDEKENELITASIIQKTNKIKLVQFNSAIRLSNNKKHIKWLILPMAIILSLFISGKKYVITESSARIIKHNTFFEPEAPFKYIFQNELSVVQYENYELNISLSGNEIPSDVYIEINNSAFKLTKLNKTSFNYLFKSVNQDISFRLLAGGYKSNIYTLTALPMPKVIDFDMRIDYPKYTKIKPKVISNNGDVTVPEGTKILWTFNLKNTDSISFNFNNKDQFEKAKNPFLKNKEIKKTLNYTIITKNNNLTDSLKYKITTVKDNYPIINVELLKDSSNENYFFKGAIEDDYGLSALYFNYKIITPDTSIYKSERIKIEGYNQEIFYYNFNTNSVSLNAGSEMIFFFNVFDNDEINGPKKTKSDLFKYKELTKKELLLKKDSINNSTKSKLNNSKNISAQIQENIKKLNKHLIEKENVDWEVKKLAKEIIDQQKQLEKQIKSAQKSNSSSIKSQEKMQSESIEKQKQLDELIQNLIDEETKKLIDELEKKLSEIDKNKLKNLLEKLDAENNSIERELERELELLKQLELEQKIEEALEKVQDLISKQKTLEKETSDKKINTDDLSSKQEKIKDEFEEIKKDLNDIKNKNDNLEEKINIPSTNQEENDINELMDKSSKELKRNNRKKSKKKQNEAIENLKKLKQSLNEMEMQCNSESNIEDMDALRQILENLITLSFEQEKLISETNNIGKNNPKYLTIVQNQKKLSDDSKIIEDSLFALSKRVVEIKSIINKEITSVKINMQKATKELEERNKKKATNRQQYVMTSTNNLALILSEILEQMQKDLNSPSSQCNKPKNCNKPSNSSQPSLSELKKAQKRLSQSMKERNKGKNTKENAKELMMLARQQEEIRNNLLKLRDEIGKTGEKGKIDDLLNKMEQNETDIVNNRITKESLKRQTEIFNKLLEFENAQKEKDQDSQRESTEWIFEDNNNIKYQEYLKKKTAQQELIKTTPIQLTPYYKTKVKDYFNSLLIKHDNISKKQ